ncbi:MAG: hypothetical protein LBV47_06565 [Bacteroidales bacterium]|jgi:hypothetical protein|nr:hypothetical protein [Bacteroidales bacterium]
MCKNILVIMVMFAIVIGCEKELEVISILPISESDMPEEVAAFFEEHLPGVSEYGNGSGCFFLDDEKNKSLMINSIDELKAAMYSPFELPDIDFGKYTLVIGQHLVGGTAYRVREHNIVIKPEGIELNISVEKPDGTYWVICPVYYWGLYPKLAQEFINVNLIVK